MAKQIGEIIIVGTIDDITFYEMEGQGYARSKSRLRGERVKRAKEFARTMQSARRLGLGSQLASKVYRSLPRTEQVYALFKELKSMAVLAIKEGKGEAEVMMLLQQRVGKNSTLIMPAVVSAKKTPVARTSPSFTKRLFSVRSGRRRRRLGSGSKAQRVKVLRE